MKLMMLMVLLLNGWVVQGLLRILGARVGAVKAADKSDRVWPVSVFATRDVKIISPRFA
jgi:hypothetical protein